MDKEFTDLIHLLNKHRIVYKVSEHEKVHTSEQAASIRGTVLQSGVKALVFDVTKKDGRDVILVLVRGDHKVDADKLKLIVNASNARLADPMEVLKRTGCEIGSVHPFGQLFGMQVYMDKLILESMEVNFSAGMHTKSISIQARDMVKIIQPNIVDIAKSP